jgi:plasmid stability protein
VQEKEELVASLQVREVPQHIYHRLAQAARLEHRSLAQEAVAVLARGLETDQEPRARRQKLVARLLEENTGARKTKVPDPVSLVREDRSR